MQTRLTRLTRLTHLSRPTRGFLSLLCAAAVLTACGGGGGADPVAPAAKTAFSAGAITGFGSIIVNGVRFDDSSASVSDDDGTSRRNDELRLGMVAEIDSASITTDASDGSLHGKAKAIRFGSEIVGPVSSVAVDGKSLVVLGQTVQITATTLFDDRLVGGLAGLVAGTSVIEVHGLVDVTTGAYAATRIEPKQNAPYFKLRGVVSNLNTIAKTFKIGSGADTISYLGLTAALPADMRDTLMVRVKLQTTQINGQWVATNIKSGVRKLDDHDEAEIEGRITATTFTVDKKFSVNGVPVDATNATFPKGSAGVVLGARVEVKGSAVNGVVMATKVKVEDDHERDLEGFELHGIVSAFDGVAKTFVLRGVTVSFADPAVVVRKGVLADLANGKKVEVKGVRSSDGTTLVATRISFES